MADLMNHSARRFPQEIYGDLVKVHLERGVNVDLQPMNVLWPREEGTEKHDLHHLFMFFQCFLSWC